MWTLLLWLNQKIVAAYKAFQRKRSYKRISDSSRDLPDYLRRDMGLPPYDQRNNHFDL